jgi:hypothetical protein
MLTIVWGGETMLTVSRQAFHAKQASDSAATPKTYVITDAALKATLNFADVDTASPSIVIQTIERGVVQKWNGTAWVVVPTGATATLAQRSLSVGGKIRWVPPADVFGNLPALKVRAHDGVLKSTVTAQVSIHLAPA